MKAYIKNVEGNCGDSGGIFVCLQLTSLFCELWPQPTVSEPNLLSSKNNWIPYFFYCFWYALAIIPQKLKDAGCSCSLLAG
jgi:hypothetical protein